jgi:hypothetical protein
MRLARTTDYMASEPGSHRQDESASSQDSEDPLSPGLASTALAGFLLATLTLSLPLLAVVNDRSGDSPGMTPAALEHDGSSPTAPISVTRVAQPAG